MFNGEYDPHVVSTEVQNMFQLAYKLKMEFDGAGHAKPAIVADMVRNLVQQFRDQYLELVHALCNPGLRERHWKLISQAVEYPLEP